MAEQQITVALAGNPNSGKTSIFNALTGARQHVGNYPGVTVEKKEGTCHYRGYTIRFVDLPGTYSLTAHSIEEVVARNVVIRDCPDVVVNVVDSSNIERNLYLTTQLLELNAPLILALNMSDLAKKKGFTFDDTKISSFFNTPVVHTIGSKSQGIDSLLSAIIQRVENASAGPQTNPLYYGEDIERALTRIEDLIPVSDSNQGHHHSRWLALKLLEQDEEILKQDHSDEVLTAVSKQADHLQDLYGDRPDVLLAEKRYGFISGAYEQAVHRSVEKRHDISDLIDTILLNRALGLFFFFGLMYCMFKLTFFFGNPLSEIVVSGFEWLSRMVTGWWPPGSTHPLKSLLVDGIIGGVGGVISFLPNIVFLFLGIALLEDTGYMARGAFLMDRVMRSVGLHGKSFIPMVIGFGCSVPAILGTRILEDRKSRIATIMVLPLMSCGARFPIYALITSAFFAPQYRGFVMWSMYMIGILIAAVLSILLRKTLLKGKSGAFLLELPPYRMPTPKGLLIHMWNRSWLYLKKAGTVILAISLILWAASTYPKAPDETLIGLNEQEAARVQLRYSLAGRIGTAIEPVIKPLGFDYRIGTALIGALAAKEVFVAQMFIVFSISETGGQSSILILMQQLTEQYTPLQGFCVMLFCLISSPCVATFAVTRRETNSWRWAVFQYAGLTLIAYTLTFIVYQTGSWISQL
jgi:ferrous iron transport protein B